MHSIQALDFQLCFHFLPFRRDPTWGSHCKYCIQGNDNSENQWFYISPSLEPCFGIGCSEIISNLKQIYYLAMVKCDISVYVIKLSGFLYFQAWYLFLTIIFMLCFQVKMLEPKSCTVLCPKDLTEKESALFAERIMEDYSVHM